MPEKELKGKYLWGIVFALFLTACGVKWGYMAQQHYHVIYSDELPGSYNIAKTLDIQTLLHQLSPGSDCTMGSGRPFFTALLYILSFKFFGYGPQVAWIMGIIVGSLLAPLYFLVVAALINVEVALFSSLTLLWMTNYIWQSIALTTILPGILFIVGALLAATRYYRRGDVGGLYGSGFLISMSVFCRYENAFLVPAFIGYEVLFDKEGAFSKKFAHGLLCTGSILYILYGNYHLFGDPFNMIRRQLAVALLSPAYVPLQWAKLFEIVGGLLLRLLSPLQWAAAVAGMVIMTVRTRLRALWIFSGALLLPLFLICKLKSGTLDRNENYFLLLALLALPVGMECVRALFERLGCRRVFCVIALGAVAFCSTYSFYANNRLPPDPRLYYSHELIRVTEDLKRVPATAALYLDDNLIKVGIFPASVLVYLNRHPQKYHYFPGQTDPQEKEYYLLTREDETSQTPLGERVKVRDYRAYGFGGVVLFRVTHSLNEK